MKDFYTISFYNVHVCAEIEALPLSLRVRFSALAVRMQEFGPNLGEPHTKVLGKGLIELRLKSQDGIARVLYCALVGKRIMILHSFVKKTQKTPQKELMVALKRIKEMKNENL